MIKVGIIGATGYAGEELIRLLLNHPQVEICAISSISYEKQTMSSVYPSLYQIFDKVIGNDTQVLNLSDVIFASLPHGLSEKYAKYCDENNKIFIDLGADFRLTNPEDYENWYHLKYEDIQLHQKAVYGLSEINRECIKDAMIIGNPGCYPTSIALGLYPAIKEQLIDIKNIIIDSKSGLTGSGRALSIQSHFSESNETFNPDKIGEHRHTPEIEQTLTNMAGEDVKITFVPHVLPINRGILSTIYTSSKNCDIKFIHDLYTQTYKNEPFIRVLPLGDYANIKNVKYSNYCDISVHVDVRNNRLIIVSAIDNMVKGAAGQAIQNMNIRFGLAENTGLNYIPPAF